ncbi:MAG: hypothetical protein ABJE95_02695 [Byssovorax sp.]
MSSGSHDTHAAADHDHAFDGEPTDELPADEPRTPGWLPALGMILFVVAATAFLATRETPAPTDAPAPEKAAAAAPVAPAPLPPQQRIAQPMAAPAPAGSDAAAALARLSPEQRAALQKQLEIMKAKAAANGAQPAH